jgi:hypothetical protein
MVGVVRFSPKSLCFVFFALCCLPKFSKNSSIVNFFFFLIVVVGESFVVAAAAVAEISGFAALLESGLHDDNKEC